MKKSFTYIQEKVEKSYLNGNLAETKHLCTIACEKYEGGVKNFEDILWTLPYLIITIFNRGDFLFINRVYKKIKTEGDIFIMLDFILETLEPQLSPDITKRHYDKILSLNLKSITNNNNIYMLILLEKVVELFWYINDKQYTWESVCDFIINNCSNLSAIKSLGVLKQRLKIQHNIINGNVTNAFKEINIGFENNIQAKLLAQAWCYYFNTDWIQLDSHISKMTEQITFESDYYLPLQGIINMTMYMRNSASDNKDTKIYYANYARYNRFKLEKQLSAFNNYRINNIKQTISHIKLDPYKTATERSEVLTLLILSLLSDLRYWDFCSYFDLQEMKYEFSYSLSVFYDETGSYTGMSEWLEDTILLAIKANKTGLEKTELNIAVGLIEVKYKNAINNIFNYIINCQNKVEWITCIEVLGLMGDVFTQEQITSILEWIDIFFNFEKAIKSGYNLNRYSFLTRIIFYYDFTPKDWLRLKRIIDTIFEVAGYFATNKKLIEAILFKADRETCLSLFEKMKKNKYEPQITAQYIYNTSIARDDLLIDGIKTLENLYTETNHSIYKEYAQYLKVPIIAELQETDLSEQESELNQLIDRINKNTNNHFTIQDESHIKNLYYNTNWKSVPINVVINYIEKIKNTIISSNNIKSSEDLFTLLYLFRAIALRCDDTVKKDIINFTISILKENIQVKKGFSTIEHPLQTFHFTTTIKDERTYIYLLIICDFYMFITNDLDKEYILHWCLDEMIHSEDELQYFYTYIFVLSYTLGNETERGLAYTGLMLVNARIIWQAQKSDRTLERTLIAISHLVEHINYFGTETLIDELNSLKNNKLLKLLIEWCNQASISPNYLAREKCAELLFVLIKDCRLQKFLCEAEYNLKNDVRLSVKKKISGWMS